MMRPYGRVLVLLVAFKIVLDLMKERVVLGGPLQVRVLPERKVLGRLPEEQEK